ncbi:MAG: tRNA 2-thiouridine(34) synthase MnmA [Phycisphaerae bacterium]|nr:tRNA 2-thiouridine(34) synthase MnmA [Phycisphaerae bacterium]
MTSGSRTKVVVAMSGGVDSSVAACLLHEQGHEVVGLFMRTGVEGVTASADARDPDPVAERHRGCCSALDASDARAVAGRLGVPFFALNFKADFERIIDHFAGEYLRGRTPNPCVMCNEYLKFGRLAEYGRAVGADFVATGHYARIDRCGDEYCLRRGRDTEKDQSYVLFGMGREMLSRTLFPIGELTKEQVRAEARRFGLPICDKRESQDICFVPDRDYARVVRERRPDSFVPGAIVDREGHEVGRHEGIAHFTVGQRRGLRVAMGKPIYVTRIDAKDHTVTIGSREDLAADHLEASSVRWLIEPPTHPLHVEVKIRYTHRPAAAVVEAIGPDRVRVAFREPQTAITPGQAAVLYDEDMVLGGGWIDH